MQTTKVARSGARLHREVVKQNGCSNAHLSAGWCGAMQKGQEYTFTIRDTSGLKDGTAFRVSYDAFVDDVQVGLACTAV